MVGYAGIDIDIDLHPIQGQGQGHWVFELPTTSEAVHAGGDDRSPLAGLSGLVYAYDLVTLYGCVLSASIYTIN